MRVLVVNAGSSSLKLRLLDDDHFRDRFDLHAGPDGFDTSHLVRILDGWETPDVVGHRIVHGGTEFNGPVRITPGVRQLLGELTDLAPSTSPSRSPRSTRSRRCYPTSLRLPVSTQRSTPPSEPQPRRTRCRARGESAGQSAATGSMGCRTPTARFAPHRCSNDRATGSESSPVTSVLAHPWRRCSTVAASTPPWDSHRSKAWVMATRSGTVDP